ncbi:acyl-CoA carboxylase subunit epsilon [Streptomyces sp. 130]|uniref:acyl-CoA carboxylase subunit epsilon n=1 Tax=Streptomyces sp. 130 TaxID=2591006 RepID=UPI00117C4CD6|nr:acyl-CoA carboxylase subunit epsilon [Streptomyces sp. 130]TRV73186.1 acyl-CoA carboxylase subunit epsilon [Streptomyces sp. 130]
MGGPEPAAPALRIERGRATEEELAALMVVLLALRAEAGGQRGEVPAGRVPGWSPVPVYRAPRSWRRRGNAFQEGT